MVCLLLLTVMHHETIGLVGTAISMADASLERGHLLERRLYFPRTRDYICSLESWKSSSPLSQTLATPETTCLSLLLSLPLFLLASQNLPGLQPELQPHLPQREMEMIILNMQSPGGLEMLYVNA